MWITAILLGVFIFLCVKWIFMRREQFRVFRSIGVPGPQPSHVDGNSAHMNKMGYHPWLKYGTEKYGKVWGYYDGASPIMVISDLDMLKQILIQDFGKFTNRKKLALLAMQDEYVNVFDAEGPRWKRLRTISAPSFTAKRMKEMSPLINNVVDKVMVLWKKHSDTGEAFNIHGEFQKMTLDVITSTAFGIDTESVSKGDSIFLQKVRHIFSMSTKNNKKPTLRRAVLFLLMNVPALQWIFARVLTKFAVKMVQWFFDMAENIIVERKKNPTDRRDFINLMLEANEINPNVTDDKLTAKSDEEEDTCATESEPTLTGKVIKGLTLQEIKSQCFIFLFAGYETTSSALGFLSYELALNPDIQRRLQAEIDENFPEENCQPDYTTVSKLKYMDMVVNEGLRLHNIAALATTRTCQTTCRVGEYLIPKGTVIQISSNEVMLDRDIWGPEDPSKFIPERFTPERKSSRHPLAFLAFGGGPRNCVGMRFALMEIKIALTRLLKDYSLKSCSDTKVPLPVATMAIQSPSEGVYVTIHERSKHED